MIEAYEHSVVVLCRFIDHLPVRKGIHHITIQPSAGQQIGINSAHVIIALRQYEWLWHCTFNRRRYGKGSVAATEQVFYSLGIVLVVEPSDEVNGVTALLVVLVKPQVSPNGDLL